MPAINDQRYTVQCGWDDVPHLDKGEMANLLASTPPYLRAARSLGTPSLGAGAIYPISEDQFIIEPFAIPKHWPRAYALDVGWNRTACLWGAIDAQADTVYLYTEHYRGEAEPSIHATAIRARGAWIQGVIDPASAGSGQKDGEQLSLIYQGLGLNLTPAVNAVDAGIYEVWERLSQGRLKVFKTLSQFRQEYRQYRRDEKGKIVKKNDHLMDCARYLCLSGISVMTTEPRIAQPGAYSEGAAADRRGGY